MCENRHWKSQEELCVIGNDVWIGSGANIFRGVTIGDGAVIGGSSVVTKDVPPYAIVAGNPAKIFRYRCKEEWIEKLLELKWWELPIDIIKDELPAFQGELTIEVIEKLQARKKAWLENSKR